MTSTLNSAINLITTVVNFFQDHQKRKKVFSPQRLETVRMVTETIFQVVDMLNGGSTSNSNNTNRRAPREDNVSQLFSETQLPTMALFRKLHALHNQLERTEDPKLRVKIKAKIRALNALVLEEDEVYSSTDEDEKETV